MSESRPLSEGQRDALSNIVRLFLSSNLSILLIIASLIIGASALWITPREEDPQIVVPLADVTIQFPGHSALEVEQLVAAPLERMLYQIDGVEYVYSMSRDDSAIVTVRFYVGQDRERSLVKLFKKLNESSDSIPPGVTSWVMKPVEIDDVPIVTLALTSSQGDSYTLRRVSEELVERLSTVTNVSRAYVIGGQSRTVSIEFDPERLRAYGLTAAEVVKAVGAGNAASPAGHYAREDREHWVATESRLASVDQLENLVVGVFDSRPVFLKDAATVRDGPDEVKDHQRLGWGKARTFHLHPDTPGTILGESTDARSDHHGDAAQSDSTHELSNAATPAVTIAISKQKGANAVKVAAAVIAEAKHLRQTVVPDDLQLVVTRNSGVVANEKVNELVEALGVAIVIVILLLTIGLGWREAFIVSVTVPVVFGLTLAVNLLCGYTINRVTLFALILALGLLVDDPIVDVENIARHFKQRQRATREIVLDAVAEIRPPLISATLAVIVSFLPMFFITGMMGPYMSPMALNVPVAMFMSMVVAFTITPWLSYHVLGRSYRQAEPELLGAQDPLPSEPLDHETYDPDEVRQTWLYRFFRPLMLPLLRTRIRAVLFLFAMAMLTLAAMSLGALRMVPLKMLPFDNKNELLLVVDLPEDATLERTDAVMREFESVLSVQPEIINFVTTTGTSGPIDFNGLVRHYYLRTGVHQAEIRVNMVAKKNRWLQSHGLALRMRDDLERIARDYSARLSIVELPPGPPVLASLVAEVYGREDHAYSDLLDATAVVAQRMRSEPGVVEVRDVREVLAKKYVFEPDQEKAALAGVTTVDIAEAIRIALAGDSEQCLRIPSERRPLRITFRLPRQMRSSPADLAQLPVKGRSGQLILLSELGAWNEVAVQQTIYHKNLRRVAYVFGECVGRTPAECIVDILADQAPNGRNRVENDAVIPVAQRTFLNNGGNVAWQVADGIETTFTGEGEWKITLDVFRDLGLAFAAAMVMIYVILVAQTGSFLVPVIVMLAIPLTALGVMPGFYLLNAMLSQPVGGYADPVFFTATAMIGMIALAGIVTRDSIILVDFMQQAVARGRPLVDAVLESRVVRLRPILLTTGAAMFSAVPITLDPIFSGLGWSLIFGLIASTLFTLFVIPVTYWLLYQRAADRSVDTSRGGQWHT